MKMKTKATDDNEEDEKNEEKIRHSDCEFQVNGA
jgi:hypothetical protein